MVCKYFRPEYIFTKTKELNLTPSKEAIMHFESVTVQQLIIPAGKCIIGLTPDALDGAWSMRYALKAREIDDIHQK